ncbi:hypothetical protein ACP70R_043810 [Stipagrostis hirtigluma subsp. patula]
MRSLSCRGRTCKSTKQWLAATSRASAGDVDIYTKGKCGSGSRFAASCIGAPKSPISLSFSRKQKHTTFDRRARPEKVAAEDMADSAVSFVLGKLGEFVAQEAGVLKEVGKDVVLFKDKLQWLQTFVQQADRRRRREGNAYMDVWVEQTREVALEVEDILDKFMLRANVEQGQPMWKKWFKFLSTCATQISVRHELAGEIAMVRARLDQISEHKTAYIKEDSTSATRIESSATWVASPSISTTDGWLLMKIWDDELEVIGFENQCLSLERLLLEGDERRSIVSIVGESGIGKSSLVYMVVESLAVKRHFKAYARFFLPPCASLAYALGSIYKRLCPFADTPATVEGIQGALSDYLKYKSYLIVVNGADKFFNWSSMLDALPDNEHGSRVVIINSFIDNEATLAGLSDHELRVTRLDQKNSILLFRRHAVGRANQHLNRFFYGKSDSSGSEYKEAEMDETCKDSLGSECVKKMDQACTDMFEITGGLPLAILLLGRLLRRKEFPEQWEDVLKPLKSIKASSHLEGILALCFDDLPHHLKSCFMYFATRPQNMKYSARRLVWMWAAQGFLKTRKGERIEDVGHNYLKELISRGMVCVVEKSSASQESMVKRVDIHQSLYALARFESQEGSFLDISDSTEIPSSTTVRHLYIQNLTAATYTHMEEASFPKLRSVTCHFSEYWESRAKEQQGSAVGDLSHHNHFLKHLGRSKLLRAMELYGLQVKKLPDVIGSLIHLRYLYIRDSYLVELPSTIANLVNLQTLHIEETKVEKVTPAFWKITMLRHIIANELRLPKSVGVLKNMQTLEGMVCVHPWHNNTSPLHSMINLRLLKISGLTSHHWGALADAFKQLESLLEVHLTGDDIPFNLFTEFRMRRLQVLKLYGRIDVSTEETEGLWTLTNLTMLELWYSKVNQGFINMIGKLPRLAELELVDAYEGEELVLSQESGFRNLTNLELHSLSGLSEWKIGSESLPKIETIYVFNCSNMRLKLEGEQVLKNLKEFLVENMPDNWGQEEAGALSEKFTRRTTS